MNDRFERLLKSRIGLDASSVGSAVIERAVRQRMSGLALHDEDEYWMRLNGSPGEVQALIEAVVVPETWFFRYPESFTTLARLAFERLPSLGGGRALRILSLPCSTGEEPYSIVMALLDAGLSEYLFEVDALDVSARVIERASLGVYGRNSFRGDELGFRDRHFSEVAEGYQLGRAGSPQGALPLRQFARSRATGGRGTLRFRVLSQPADLFRPPDPERGGRGAQAPVAVGRRDVHRSGRGEPAQPARHAADRRAAVFRVPPDQRGAPRRAAQGGERRSAPGRCRRRGACEYSAFAAATGETAPAAVQPGSASQRPALASPVGEFDEIARLADAGQHREARAACERQLAARGPSATVFYWLGLLSDVAGQEQEAQDFYRKRPVPGAAARRGAGAPGGAARRSRRPCRRPAPAATCGPWSEQRWLRRA